MMRVICARTWGIEPRTITLFHSFDLSVFLSSWSLDFGNFLSSELFPFASWFPFSTEFPVLTFEADWVTQPFMLLWTVAERNSKRSQLKKNFYCCFCSTHLRAHPRTPTHTHTHSHAHSHPFTRTHTCTLSHSLTPSLLPTLSFEQGQRTDQGRNLPSLHLPVKYSDEWTVGWFILHFYSS